MPLRARAGVLWPMWSVTIAMSIPAHCWRRPVRRRRDWLMLCQSCNAFCLNQRKEAKNARVQDLTNTLLHQSKRSLPFWILAAFLLCLSCSSRRIARELGGHTRTSYRWCWWLRNSAVSYETDRQLEGTVEADDLSHTAGQKGQAPGGGTKALGRRARSRRKKREPGRGHYDKDRPAIIAWVSRQGAVVLHATRDFTVQTVQKAADIAVKTGSRLYTDSASSYRALKGYAHDFVNHTKKEYARGEVHENRAECLFSLLKPYLRVFRGVS